MKLIKEKKGGILKLKHFLTLARTGGKGELMNAKKMHGVLEYNCNNYKEEVERTFQKKLWGSRYTGNSWPTFTFSLPGRAYVILFFERSR